MVLSNVEIIAEIQAGRLVFDPPISLEHSENRIASSSVDLLLHETLMVLPADVIPGLIVDPSAPEH